MAEEKNVVQKGLSIGRHKSAIKRARQSLVRHARNVSVRSEMRTYIKNIRSAIASKNKKEAEAALKIALPYIAKAASKGVVPSQTASRYTSRLTKAVQRI